jgi:hypothetical protein
MCDIHKERPAVKDADDRKTRELHLVRSPGRKPILGRNMTPAERQERSRLLRAAAVGHRLDEADGALRLIRHELHRTSPDLDAAVAALEAHLAGLRTLLKV